LESCGGSLRRLSRAGLDRGGRRYAPENPWRPAGAEAASARGCLGERALQDVGSAGVRLLDAYRSAINRPWTVEQNRVAKRKPDSTHHQSGGEQQSLKALGEQSGHGVTVPRLHS